MTDNDSKDQNQADILETAENRTNKVLELLLKKSIDNIKVNKETE